MRCQVHSFHCTHGPHVARAGSLVELAQESGPLHPFFLKARAGFHIEKQGSEEGGALKATAARCQPPPHRVEGTPAFTLKAITDPAAPRPCAAPVSLDILDPRFQQFPQKSSQTHRLAVGLLGTRVPAS